MFDTSSISGEHTDGDRILLIVQGSLEFSARFVYAWARFHLMYPPELPWRWQEGEYTVTRTCPWSGPGCHNQCGILVYSKDNRVVKVEGDPEIPFSEGRLCVRCLVLPKVVHSPYRLTQPLKRAGERGEGKWQPVSWAEALDIIEENTRRVQRECGHESVVVLTGTGRNISHILTKLSYSAFQSPNMSPAFFSGIACYAPKLNLMQATFGGFIVADCSQMFPDRYDNPDWRVPECMIIWGNNPVVSHPDSFMGYWIVECMKRGTKLIVIDPRLTWMASRADVWLQLRPGTDPAIALGLINIIIQEGLFDRDFVAQWTDGWDRLKERAAEYPPERVEEITWVPKEKLIKAARLYAGSKPASIQWGVAMEQHQAGMSTLLAVEALWAITGNVDVPGGNIINRPGVEYARIPPWTWGIEDVPRERFRSTLGREEYPFYKGAQPDAMSRAMLTGQPYPLKMAWMQATNPLACTGADPKRVYEAMRQCEFVVDVDLFMTPSATALADLVLPAASVLERDSVRAEFVGGWWGPLRAVNKVVQVGECKSDEEILLEVGKRLNPDAFPWANVEEMLDWLIRDTGLTFAQLRESPIPYYAPFEYRKHEKGLLRRDGMPGFRTESGKFNLYVPAFEKIGLDPLPYYEEPPESPISTPELAAEYPFVLTTGARSWGFFHSEHRQIPEMREIDPDPEVEIHPDTAAGLGIMDGDWVWIENGHGRCKQKARLTIAIDPRVIHAKHGWWYPEKEGAEPSLFGVWDHNVNQLLPWGWQGPSGYCAPYKSLICKVYKAE